VGTVPASPEDDVLVTVAEEVVTPC
jgi:hypothetical protein